MRSAEARFGRRRWGQVDQHEHPVRLEVDKEREEEGQRQHVHVKEQNRDEGVQDG